jgi:GT2 family glycosyltransferase
MSAASWPRASVIVVGHNSAPYLRRCLGALLAQDYPGGAEIIVVDNASRDGSAALVERLFPNVRVIAREVNDGFAGGANYGAAVAGGDVLAFINPDTEADRPWLTELVRPLLADGSIGMTTSRITLLGQPGIINTCGNDVSLAGVATCRRAGQPAADVRCDEDVAAVSGAAFAMRATLFRRLGGFDAAFFMYLEDTDLSLRARQAGYRCVLAAASVVAHDYRLALTPEKVRRIERNRYRMLAKNFRLTSLALLLPQLLLAELIGFGWASLHGPRYVRAKLSAILWLCANLREIRAARRDVLPLGYKPDIVVLRQHAVVPPVRAVATGPAGRLAAAGVAPVALLAALPLVLLLAFMPSTAGYEPAALDDADLAAGHLAAGD